MQIEVTQPLPHAPQPAPPLAPPSPSPSSAVTDSLGPATQDGTAKQEGIWHQGRAFFRLSNPERSPALDTMRGLVALMICLTHMSEQGFSFFPMAITYAGSLRVNIFFTLSGYFIARSVLRPPSFSGARFIKNRSRRILPSYLIALFLVVALVDASALIAATPGSAFLDFGLHLTLLHGWFGQYSLSIMGPYWTLSHEWCFYLLMLLGAPLLRSRRWWLLPVAMIVAAFLSRCGQNYAWWHLPKGIEHKFPISLWDQFAFGILAARLVDLRGKYWTAIFGIVGVTLLAWGFWKLYGVSSQINPLQYTKGNFTARAESLFYRSASNNLYFSMFFALGVSGIILCCERLPRAFTFLRWTPLPFLGEISYSTYLYHLPIIICFARATKHAAPDSWWQSSGFNCVVLLAFIYTASIFFYRLVELPWIQRHRRSPNYTPHPAGFGSRPAPSPMNEVDARKPESSLSLC